MNNLYLYNSLSKSKELFKPISETSIGMYVCGPTVYDYPHLGNALAVVIYDVLFRLLRHLYGQDMVVYVRNITDVDDKIINAALEQNISVSQLTDKITKVFQDNMSKLNCLQPSFEPKATEHIAEMIAMIQSLLDKDYAYISDSHVYFRVNKFTQYGDLSGRVVADLIAGSRVEVATAKENPEDFVLWKTSEDEGFDSPFGFGRPGWHIECSAMSCKYLGYDFDIHGGGVDLIFPHHTNEIAQSCCANPGSSYSKFWVHNGFLTVNGEKMSKSLGNFVTIDELLRQGVHGEVIRYVLLNSHYRKPIDWNEKALQDAKKALDSFYRVLLQTDANTNLLPEEFINSLLDDLNTANSFALLHDYASAFNKESDNAIKSIWASKLKTSATMLGLLQVDPQEWFTNDALLSKSYIEQEMQKRLQAKLDKNWLLADQIRDDLKKQGIILEDSPDGRSSWRRA
jgi:cysteinyl-tRNA synthetase